MGIAALLLAACRGADGAPPGRPEPAGEQQEALVAAPRPAGGPTADPLAGLDARSLAALHDAPVEALLLPPGWNDRSTVTSGRGFYAVSARDGEISLYLHATDVVHDPGDGTHAPPRDHRVRGHGALVLVDEGIRSVTWEEGATSYVLEVECYRPFEDTRCTESGFVLDLAEHLVEVPR